MMKINFLLTNTSHSSILYSSIYRDPNLKPPKENTSLMIQKKVGPKY